MIEKTSSPLVSVVVLTYNSSNTVIETLDSIKEQSYQAIELIVTDDYSQDDTNSIVQNWINGNKNRFVHAELVVSEKNTGVSGNINRGVACTHGVWIKSIAGDDILMPMAIEQYVTYVTNSLELVRMCVCDVQPFSDEGEIPIEIFERYDYFFKKEQEPYKAQLKRVMTSLIFVGPTYFYSKELFDEVGGFSEEYGNAEEWPFVYKVLRGGIYAIDKKLVRYRVGKNSLCHAKNDSGLGNKSMFMGNYNHYFDHPFKDLIKDGHMLIAWHHALLYWNKRIQYNVTDRLMREIIKNALLLFSPIAILHKLRLINFE